jgi:hypothetical protein
MYNFRTYTDLHESLDKPVDFYMTDDTELPRRVYAAFEIDGTNYGISMEETNFDRVYQLKMYRVVNVKPRYWNFAKQSHARKSLATLLKFMEAITPFLKNKMDAIIIPIPASSAAEKYNKFIDRVIRKSYVTTFRQVPVRRVSEKKDAYNHLFIIRKPIQPSAIFKTKSFKKYEFDPSELPAEVADDIEPKRRARTQVSLGLSKDSRLEDFVFTDVEIDDEVFEQISAVNVREPKTRTNEDLKKRFDDDPLPIIRTLEDTHMLEMDDTIKYFEDDVTDVIPALVGFDDVAGIMIGSADPFTALKNAINAKLKNDIRPNLAFKKGFAEIGAFRDGENMFSDEQIRSFVDGFEDNLEVHEAAHKDLRDMFDRFRRAAGYVQMEIDYRKDTATGNDFTAETYTTDFDVDVLKTNLPGEGAWDYEQINIGNFDTYGAWGEYDNKKADYVYEDLGYGKQLDKLPSEQRSAIYKYTGSTYALMNNNMRKLVSAYYADDKMEMKKWMEEFYDRENIKHLMDAFKNLEPLPEPMWVYRGTDMPMSIYETIKAGQDYVDPAFMSTTLKSSMVFKGGLYAVDSENISVRSRIYLPKGSRVIPALYHSEHSNEREIILPPMSVLKTVRLDYIQGEKSWSNEKKHAAVATMIYTGNFSDEIMSKIEKKLMSSVFYESKKPTYDVKSLGDPKKFGGRSPDKDTMKKIADAIKSGELKGKKH